MYLASQEPNHTPRHAHQRVRSGRKGPWGGKPEPRMCRFNSNSSSAQARRLRRTSEPPREPGLNSIFAPLRAHRSWAIGYSVREQRGRFPSKAGNIGIMWAGFAKAAAGRAVLPKHCAKLPAALNTARVGSGRRKSTSGAEATEAEVMEPDPEVLQALVCPLSKVSMMESSSSRILNDFEDFHLHASCVCCCWFECGGPP